MSERYTFHEVTQMGRQNITDFVLCLNHTAKNWDFENRDISLKDQVY